MLKSKSIAIALSATIAITSFLPVFADQYTPRYNNGGYSSPGANYNLKTSPQGTYQQNYQQGYNQNYNQGSYMPPLQGRVVTVPAGTSLSAIATAPISSEFVTTGDSVAVMLGAPFYYNGIMIAPSNSTVQGNVVVSEKAGLAGKNGKLKIRFTNIITPSGQRIPISGKILTNDGTGMLVGGTTKDRMAGVAKNTAIGAVGGALAGTIFGPLSGGKVGKGAALGSAVGGGLGLGKAVIDKGNNVVLDSNSSIDIVIDQPVTINPTSSY